MDRDTSHIHILFVGGGTGGHFYPLISIAEALNARGDKLKLFYAGPDQYDKSALEKENISFVSVAAGKKRRYLSALNIFDFLKTAWGILVAIVKLFVLYPDVVMSKGGYTSVPIVLAAAFLRIPIVIHESDAVMGRANRIATCFARYVITAYEETSTTFLHPVVLVLGIPVRRSLLSERGEQALATFAISPTRPVLLVLGGSQGAERINQFILDTLDELLTDFTIIHQTGIKNLEICKLSADRLITDIPQRNEYHPVGFLDSTMLNDAYHRADIVISRAGSNSIYEIALHGKPAILIPIPEEVSHDQRTNAYTYARTGAAIVMEEKNLTDNLLRAEIDRMMQSEVYDQMVRAAQSFGKRDAGERIAELLMSIAKEHKT